MRFFSVFVNIHQQFDMCAIWQYGQKQQELGQELKNCPLNRDDPCMEVLL